MIDSMRNTIIQGDCLDVLRGMPDDCIDAIVTDPPYELGFMGKSWDSSGIANSVAMWRECLRVLKPGGHLVSFGGTRTYHRMACAIEDAGFEVRDMLNYCYGSGFPKSLNIGKAVDKLQGNEREDLGLSPNRRKSHGKDGGVCGMQASPDSINFHDTKGTSPFEGVGTNLKPAHEPICLARKPISEGTIAENCLKWGCGGLDIDGSRVGTDKISVHGYKGQGVYGVGGKASYTTKENGGETKPTYTEATGRFPSNIYHDGSDEVLACFPSPHGAGNIRESDITAGNSVFGIGGLGKRNPKISGDNGGSAARFFQSCPVCIEDIQGASLMYHAKASKAERNMGCGGLEAKTGGSMNANVGKVMGLGGASLKGEHKQKQPDSNNHATVKPYSLMQRLVGLISRKGQLVLDPFAGSGTSCMAAKRLGRDYIGIDLIAEHVQIAECRVAAVKLEEETLFPEAQ